MTDIELVRLLIGTVIEATFTDAQIQAFIDMGGSVFMGAALALKSWAASIANELKSERIGDYAYTRADVENALKIAENFEQRDASIPEMDWAEMDLMDVEEDV